MKNKAILIFGLLLIVRFSMAQKPAAPDSWKLGTATGLIGELTPEALQAAQKSGIQSIEVGWKGALVNGTREERQQFARKTLADARSAGLEIWSTHIPYGKKLDISETDPEKRRQILAAVKEYIDLANEMQVKQMVIHPSTEPISDAERPDRIAACRASLRELAAYAGTKKASLALEGLPRTCLANTSREMLQILDGIDGVGICFDTNHMLQEKSEDFIRAVGSRIRTIHVADYDRVNERHWMPGRGVNDWNAIISALIKAGYQGPFMYEVVKREGDTFTFADLKSNYESLKKAWEAH